MSEFLSPAWWRALADRIHGDPEIAHVGRWTSLQLGLYRDGQGGIMTVEAGKVTATGEAAGSAPRAVLLEGSGRAWAAFLQAEPPRLHNSILAMDRRVEDFEIAGPRELLIRHLRFIELVMAQVRALAGTA